MLPIELKPALLAFLSEVDCHISHEVTQTKGRVGEVATTGELLRCLDLKPNVEPPRGLRITPADLRAELTRIAAELPGQPDVGFEIKGEGFSQIFEGRVTQADYALHLSYVDTSGDVNDARMLSWDAYYFIQAKIARTPGDDSNRSHHVWGSDATFGTTDGQPFAIECARELLGPTGLRYNLYCPSNALQLDTGGHVYRKLRDYYGDQPDEWRQAETAGLWLSKEFPSTLGEILKSDDPIVCPWALFVLDHFFAEEPDKMLQQEVVFRGLPYDEDSEAMRRKALFNRDAAFIARLQKHLVDRGARKETEALHTFTKHGYRPSINIVLKFPGYDYINALRSPGP